MNKTKPDDALSDTPKLNPGDQATPGTPGAAENVCPDCKGSGKIGAQPCQTCGGTGTVIEGIGGG
jgi:RecJ-like exonuclease